MFVNQKFVGSVVGSCANNLLHFNLQWGFFIFFRWGFSFRLKKHADSSRFVERRRMKYKVYYEIQNPSKSLEHPKHRGG